MPLGHEYWFLLPLFAFGVFSSNASLPGCNTYFVVFSPYLGISDTLVFVFLGTPAVCIRLTHCSKL